MNTVATKVAVVGSGSEFSIQISFFKVSSFAKKIHTIMTYKVCVTSQFQDQCVHQVLPGMASLSPCSSPLEALVVACHKEGTTSFSKPHYDNHFYFHDLLFSKV